MEEGWSLGLLALARPPRSLLKGDGRWRPQGPAITMGGEGGGLWDGYGSETSLHALLFSRDSKTLQDRTTNVATVLPLPVSGFPTVQFGNSSTKELTLHLSPLESSLAI